MSDESEIQNLMTTYAHGSSFQDIDMLVSTFTEDATWELAGSQYRPKGHAAIRETFTAVIAPLEVLVQCNSPALITVNGDQATARSFVRETGKMNGRDEWIEIVGHYQDRLRRTPRGWRFTHRTFTTSGLYRITTLPGAQIPVEQP